MTDNKQKVILAHILNDVSIKEEIEVRPEMLGELGRIIWQQHIKLM